MFANFEHIVHRLVIMGRGQAISKAVVEQALMIASPVQDKDAITGSVDWESMVASYLRSYPGNNSYEHLTARIEQLLIKNAIELADGNQSAAARLLGLNRTTLQAKLRRLGIGDPQQ